MRTIHLLIPAMRTILHRTGVGRRITYRSGLISVSRSISDPIWSNCIERKMERLNGLIETGILLMLLRIGRHIRQEYKKSIRRYCIVRIYIPEDPIETQSPTRNFMVLRMV